MTDLAEVKMWYFDANTPIDVGFIDDAEMAVILNDERKAYPNDGIWVTQSIRDMFSEHGKYQVAPPAVHDGVADNDGTPEYVFDHPVMLFSFQFFGQGYEEDSAGGSEWDMREGVGVGNWFATESDDLVKTGLDLLAKEKNRSKFHEDYRFARWVIALSFSGGVDAYSGEYDCTTEYLGRVDMSKIETV